MPPSLQASAHQTSPATFSVVVDGVSVASADRPVLVDVNLTFTERSRAAVIGPNGVGKSTLLRVMAGRLRPDRGSVRVTPPRTTIGLLDQELDPGGGRTVRELIADRLGVAEAEVELGAASGALAEDDSAAAANRYERALEQYMALGATDLDSRLESVAQELGLADCLLDADPRVLSGGEAERVGLATVMLSRFDLTLLDEPTNNLDHDGLQRLDQWIAGYRGGLVLVSHDRAFLERTVSTVIEIDHHHHTAAEFNGGWEAFLDQRATLAAQAAQRYADYQDERARLAQRAQQQREWATQGASRVKKSPADNDKNRQAFELAQTEKLAGKAKATLRAIDRLEEVEKPWEPWDLRFTIGQAGRSANVVAAFDGTVLQVGDFTLGPIDLEIHWADRIAITGQNGSGKSTLIRAMLGRLAPTAGTVKLGPGVIVGELDQSRSALVDDGGSTSSDGSGREATVVRAFQDSTGLVIGEARSLLAKFGLVDETVLRAVSTLSPGERTRMQLAVFQAKGVNLLVLDEPTNHLDLPAIEQLESALDGFDGTVVLVSHDRRLKENVQLTRTVDVTDFAVGSGPGGPE